MKKISLFLALALVIACSEDEKKTKPKPGNEDATQWAQCKGEGVLVVNESGAAITGAQVLIGEALNTPFTGNFLVSGGDGMVPQPAGWTMTAAVTAQASGYVRTTYFARAPGGCLTMVLRKTAQTPSFKLSGETKDTTVVSNDGYADFGLVISALTRSDLLAFDISKVISAQMDTISALGQKIEIPSNITLPRQTESYVLPITLDKPSYRLYFGEKGSQKIYAAKGRFPFQSTIDKVRNRKKFYELLNDFTIMSGVVRDLPVADGQNLPVNEIAFTGKRAFKAPALGSGEILIALAAFDVKGAMMPTDVKRIEANETRNLTINSAAPAIAIGVLKNETEFESGSGGTDRLSAVILPFNSTLSPSFIPLIPNPRLVNGELFVTRPGPLTGIHELATLAILSDVKSVQVGSTTLPFLIHQWEAYAPQWVDHMTFPQWPSARTDESAAPAGAKKRWEVTFIGSQLKDTAEMGQPVIDAATHVTHSSLDF